MTLLTKNKQGSPPCHRHLEHYLKHYGGLFVAGLSILLPSTYFLGLVGSMPQDDLLYYQFQNHLLKTGDVLTELHKLATFEYYSSNPVSLISARWLFQICSLLFRLISQESRLGPCLFSVFCYIGTNLTVYYSMLGITNFRLAILTSMLFALFPANILFATRITPDLAMNSLLTLASLGILVFLLRPQQPQRNYSVLFFSGYCFGLAWIFKEPALIMLLPLLIICCMQGTRPLLYLLLGITVGISLDCLVYYRATGNLFAHFSIIRGAHQEKYLLEYQSNSLSLLGLVDFLIPENYDFFYHARRFFHLERENPLGRFFYGYYFFFAFAAIAHFMRQQKPIPIEAKFAAIMLFGVYLLLEFGCTDIFIADNPLHLQYALIFKEADSIKFSLYFAFPVALLSASLINSLFERNQVIIAGVGLATISFSSLHFTTQSQHQLLSPLSELRQTAKFLQSYSARNGVPSITTDRRMHVFLRYFSGDRLRSGQSTSSSPSLIISGGRRGFDYPLMEQGTEKERLLPSLSPPLSSPLTEIARFYGHDDNIRKNPVVIYKTTP